jgi:hypothetical protein
MWCRVFILLILCVLRVFSLEGGKCYEENGVNNIHHLGFAFPMRLLYMQHSPTNE